MPQDSGENIEQPRIFKLTEGVFVRREIDNMGWLDLGGRTVVIDTLEKTSARDEVLQAIKKTVGEQPVGWVINTHPHPDHTALNPLFAKTGAEIINARKSEIPTRGRILEGEKRSVQIIPMPGCHTRYDCVVWLPADRTLFVGDLFGWGLIPWMGNLKEDRRQLILDTYQRLLAFEADTVVPGHGPLCTSRELARWRDYFLWLIATLEEKNRQGENIAKLNAADLACPRDMRDWWRFLAWKHEDSIKKVAKAVSRGWR